jgi:subtilisin family serine protease
VTALGVTENSAEGTTYNIVKGMDWAVAQGARVINMSFAGPHDPELERRISDARKRGIILIAAAGNAGPKSKPLYPAADRNVIAVTATDADDKLFAEANRGGHIAVAAPGVASCCRPRRRATGDFGHVARGRGGRRHRGADARAQARPGHDGVRKV